MMTDPAKDKIGVVTRKRSSNQQSQGTMASLTTTPLSISKEELSSMLSELLDVKLNPVTESVSNLKESMNYVLEEIGKVHTLEVEVSELKEEIAKFKYEQEKFKTQNQMLLDKVTDLEGQIKKNNVRLVGMTEKKNENLIQEIVSVFQRLDVHLDPNNILAHRIGPYRKGRTRPILLKLLKFNDKKSMKMVKDKLKLQNLNITDDYPEDIVKKRKVILPIFFKAIERFPELHPKLLLKSLVLNGQEYDVSNIHNIPIDELQPERVFTKELHGITAYFSKYSPLSNHFICNFEIEDQTFTSVEQYFMYSKARLFKDAERAGTIMIEHDPSVIKSLGKKIQNYNDNTWMVKAEDEMYRAMYAKFSQNPPLKAFLLETRQTEIVEANPMDSVWGVGLSLSNPEIFDKNKWKGHNLAGKVLQKVRQALE